MGEIDQRTRKYMSDARVFADAFNFLLFDGQQVLKPEELQAMDPAEIAKLYDDSDFLENEETCRPGGTSTRAKISQIFRDVLKIWGAMRDENAVYVILGIENQTDIHYAMPVRIGFYDFANYKSQVDEIGKRNRRLSKANGISLHSAEFLSGFRREDKLIPVITITVYFGAEAWDGPRTLKEMLAPLPDERLLKFVNDYKVNLLAPAEIADEDFAKFVTGLGLVLEFIKHSKDDAKMSSYESDKRFSRLERDEAELMNAVTGNRFKLIEEKGKVNMCKGLDDWQKKIEANNTVIVRRNDVRNVMFSLNCSLERAMDIIGIPEEEKDIYREKGQNSEQ